MLGTLRVIQRNAVSRRSYSYFSQKPGGGGRFFTSDKPHKGPTRATKPSKAPIASTDVPSSVEADSSTNAQVAPEHSKSSSNDPIDDSDSTTPSPLSESLPTMPTSHPNPVLPALHLNSFFSQHRPLLLLNQPVSALFRSRESERGESTSDIPNHEEILDQMGTIDDPEADADTARLLARAVVSQRIQAGREWDVILNRLGLEAESEVVQMDSVKRKRRKKITKHKYKKRRRLQRAERRRLKKS